MTKEAEKRIAELHQELLAFSEQGRPDLALPVGREAYELSQKNLNQDGELYMTSLLHLAAIEHALGNLDRAEPLYGEAIETVGRVVGMWDPVYAGLISKRAHLYHQLGRHVEAETDMKKSVEIRLEFYKEPHPDMVDDYSLLADLAEDRADYGDAKAHYLTALDILRKGKDDLPVASVLNKLGNLGKYLGNPEEAEQYLKEALDIRRRELGENAKEVGISLLNLASVYQNQADYGGARHAFDQGLEILQKTVGEESPVYAIALANSANLFRETGEYQKAAQRYIRAISILRTNPKVSSDDLTTAISNLGEVYLEMGRYAESRPLLEEALDTRRKSLPKGDPRLAYTLTNLAGLHQSTGDYASAEALHEEALKINMASFGEEHPEVAKNLHNLAGLYMLTGQDRKAEKTYNQSLDIIRHFYDDEHPSVALSIRKLGDLHMQMGNYIQAEGYYRQSREINSRTLGKVHPQVATDVFNLAKLYMAMGDYTRAERYFLEALELDIASTGQAHPNLLKTLNALADLYVGQGRYKEAVEQGLRALQIIVKTGQLNELPHAATLNVIGLAATYAGDFSAAEEAQRQAVTIRREILGEEHPEYAVSLNNLGLIYDKKGDYEQAEQYYRQALEIKDALVGTSDTGYVTARRNLAVLLAATGRANEALPMMEAVAQAEDRTIGQIFGIGSERQRMAFLRTIQKYYYAFLSLVWLNQTQSTRAKRKAYSLVLRRKGIGAEALAVQRDAVLTDKYPALKSKLNQFFTLRKRVARYFLEADGLSLAGTASMLEDLQEKKDQLEAELVRSIPEMQLTDTFEQTNVQTIADALPDDSVLVEFVRFNPFNFKAIESQGESQWQPPHYLAFVLLAGKPGAVEMLDLGEAEAIDKLIADYRATIVGEAQTGSRSAEDGAGSGADVTVRSDPTALLSAIKSQKRGLRPVGWVPRPERRLMLGTKLRQALFDPLLRVIGEQKQLFLAPDGDLFRLPFEVIPLDAERFVIDEYYISYLSVGRDLLRFGIGAGVKPGGHLVAASPNFDMAGETAPEFEDGNPFESLSGTRSEGQHVADLIDVKPLMDDSGVERAVKWCRSPQILHVASHGFFLESPADEREVTVPQMSSLESFGRLGHLSKLENPLLRSGLALAGANTWLQHGRLPEEAEDGLLTAEDVTGMDLHATDLVVLSACDTGLGEVRVGEGVFGLRRAFVLAGAQSLVMSLWKVPDDETKALVEKFYQLILGGEPRSEALRKAQLVMKKRLIEAGRDPDPYSWGAFICQGDPGPLVVQTERSRRS